jgi:hypothetical protein
MAGDPAMHEYQFADVCIETAALIPELVPGDRARAGAVVRVEWEETFPPVVAQWFHQWGEDPDLWARFGDTGHEYIVEFPALAEFRISHDATIVRGRLQPDVPEFTGRHLLLNQILPLVLSRRDRLVLHAGAVSIGGEVFAFIGPTGSGKSTLVAACANAGAEVVADDSVVISRQGNQWMAWPSYPAIRLWSSALELVGWASDAGSAAAHYTDKVKFGPDAGHWRFAAGPLPFSTIVRLGEDAATTSVAVDLYSQVFRLDVRDRAETVRLFHCLADMAAGVRVRTLRAPLEDRRAGQVAAALCGGDAVAALAVLGA